MSRENIERLKEYMKKNLPEYSIEINNDLRKIQSNFGRKKTDPAGMFVPSLKKIFLTEKAKDDEKVLAHEIAHSIEFKRTGETSHRNKYFWKSMERELGVPLFTKSPSGFETVRATNIIEVPARTSGKYSLSCANCGWIKYYAKTNKYILNCNKCGCPRCYKQGLIPKKYY